MGWGELDACRCLALLNGIKRVCYAADYLRSVGGGEVLERYRKVLSTR
jgi:hypothetical protein